MTKQPTQIEAYDITDALASIEKPATVYDAKQVLNRAMVVHTVEYKTFEPTSQNNYQVGERALFSVTFLGNGERAVVETSQKSVTIPVAALVAQGLLPFRCQIIQKGKFLSIAPA
jgi:Fe2+ or Zn2+ uptake regulation protein